MSMLFLVRSHTFYIFVKLVFFRKYIYLIELSFHLIFFPFTTRIPPQLEITRVFRTLSFF